MSLLLINSPPSNKAFFGEPVAFYPPLGILYIASYLAKHGIGVHVLDGAKQGYDQTESKLKRLLNKVDAVGISFPTWSAEGAYQIIGKIKELDSDLRVFAGGPHPTAMPGEVLNHGADFVVLGEGEETARELMVSKDPKKVKGIAFLKDRKVVKNPPRQLLDVDTLAYPSREMVDLKSYKGLYWSKHRKETNMLSSRGCPYSCFFCSNPVWKFRRPWYRQRSSENVADEVLMLKNVFGIKEVSDECDTFNVNLNHAIKICQSMKETGVSWKVQVRPTPMNVEFARRLAESGCWLVRMGIESANNQVLNGIGKGTTIKQVISSCRKLKEAGLKVIGLFMIFNVWEKNGRLMFEDRIMSENTLKLAKKMLKERLLDGVSWTFTTPLPGSRLFEVASDRKLIGEKNYGHWNQASDFVLDLPGLEEKDVAYIKTRGMLLQAKSILSDGFNPNLLYEYIRKAILMAKFYIRSV